MEQTYFAEMLDTLATRSGHATVSWLGFSNVALRRHLLDIFNRGYGNTGNFVSDPAFEAVFGWSTADKKLSELSGHLLHPKLIAAMDDPDPALASEYRFPAERKPYLHQLKTWELLSAPTKKSVVVTSGTGSGKTECFLIPILNRLVQEQASAGQPLIGVRSLFLYPLNALINSQRDRLRAWAHKLNGTIRFCLYNGMTPDVLPSKEALDGCEIRDRKTLRKTPPPILVTNATMLEYMLVRTQDAPILQASQGKLEWIILDEAHTYIGSQAAELALLIRRVLHAFDVRSEDVRFVATSATIGDPKGVAGTQLRSFLARVSGCDPEQVFVVSGEREIPKLPAKSSGTATPLEELLKLETGERIAPKRYEALVANPVARKIRSLFTSVPSKPVATLSDVCSVVGNHRPYTREIQQLALQWLDLLTSTSSSDETPFLPLRGHLFHQTLAGLWCCSDPRCPSKHGSKLDDRGWPFGALYLEPKKRCQCGAPVFQLVACDDCGAIYLHAEIEGNRVVQPNASPLEDEFALDSEDAEAEAEGGETFELSSGPALMMITNRDLPDCGIYHVRKEDGSIVQNSSDDSVSITVYEPGPDGFRCPECSKSGGTFREVFRTARVGAPFFLAGILPTLLEFAPDGDRPAEKTYRGRRLLTFTDSRQGTARLAARLQQDAERTKARGLIYHNLLALGRENPELHEQIRALEEVKDPSPVIANMLSELRRSAEQSSLISFRQLQRNVQQRSVDFEAIRSQYQAYNRELFSGANGPANVAEALLLREVGRRPKRQNNIETMGMVAVCYPGLWKIKSAPSVWTARSLSHPEWIAFLKVGLDFVVRNGGSLEIRDEMWPWLELPYVRTAIVSSATDELAKWQRRWPSVKRSRANSLLVRLLARLLRADIETPEGRDIVESLLDEAWIAVKTMLKLTANGYVLPLEQLAFRPIRKAWVCPYTRRLLDNTICGISPYLPKKVIGEVRNCDAVEIPVYDLPFGDAAEGETSVRKGREWLQQQPAISKLREEGLWSIFNDRVIEFAMYYTAAEHSAQQPSTKLQEYEKKFKEGKINILSCSTTMEMGIDIGGVQQVAMNNVPPHPANYLQRAGRAGRRQETRSIALTLCKPNPHDQNVFSNSRWAFDTVLPAPVVSLNSAIIVQRHVNSLVLSVFLRKMLKGRPEDLNKLTCGWFFVDNEPNTPAQKLATWCESYINGNDPRLQQGLQQVVRQTAFQGFSAARLLLQCAREIGRVTQAWMKEWAALLEQEVAIGKDSSDPAYKAITFQKNRLANEYLLRELATEGFLPAYGFPSNVASFDNLTVSGLRNISSAELNGIGENNRYFRRELASRDLVTALREYAPGAEIVLDGLVYRSAGITLNWHIPASEADARETQAIKFAWRCNRCGSSGTTIVLPACCEVCGAQSVECERFLEPAGFSVDFYEDPHNNVSRQAFVPVERPWVSGRGEWAPLPNPNVGRFRSTAEGRVYHHSRGTGSTQYAICLACGRAEPVRSDGELPEVFTRAGGHNKLRSKRGDRLCPGSSNRWAIVQVALGHESRTDMLEIQLRTIEGMWLQDYSTAVTLAVALRDALAELLGVQSDELGCEAREMRTGDGTRCQSIFIFDHFAAGYASNVEHLLPQMFHKAAEILDCPRKCDASCPSCVLDYDQRFEGATLDRHSALKFLDSHWLKALVLPDELRFFGDTSRAETATVFEAVLRETAGTDPGIARLYVHGAPADFAASGVRALAYKLLSLSRSVSLAITKESLDKFSEVDKNSLAALVEHPNSSVFVIDAVTKAHDAIVISEVIRANACVSWACQDTSVTSPTDSWGKSHQPIVIGNTTPTNLGKACVSTSIRPKLADISDVELTIQHELNGSIKGFGERFWKLVAQAHTASQRVLQGQNAKLSSITYHDRYLFTPASLALLHSIIRGLQRVLGPERFGTPKLEVETSAVRLEGSKYPGSKVFSDWPSSQVRNAVAQLLMQELGNADVKISDKMQHSRLLELAFSTGELLSLRFDQGVGYWRVSSWSKGGVSATSFNFGNPNPAAQAKAVAEMDVWIEGMAVPTQIFAKVREAKRRLPRSENTSVPDTKVGAKTFRGY